MDYREDHRTWEIRAMKETWACKDRILEQQLVKGTCDSTGCGVAVKVTLAGHEFRFCYSRKHKMTILCHWARHQEEAKLPSITCFRSSSAWRKYSIGAYTHLHQFSFYCRWSIMKSDEGNFFRKKHETKCGKN